ncbi:MAG: orotate phosphoribosyltransferase [Clostridiales Family XIII bacterium]|jgi:orotate phosphoribosyltransferase|nr:orotate phosphoribosyltransferase [Clostridiales Family XIII bacterium]
MIDKHGFIKFMIDAGALRFGDFTLKSGRISPYFINTGVFNTGEKISCLGSYYAECIKDAMNAGGIPQNISTVFGPAYKGIPLAVATAAALGRAYGMDAGYTFNRKEPKDHGEATACMTGNGPSASRVGTEAVLVGSPLNDGDRIIIVDDVITAGTAMREIVPLIRAAADVEICGLVLSVDRMERGHGEGGLSAVDEVRRALGIPVYPIVTVKDIVEFSTSLKIGGRPAIDEGARDRMLSYMAEHCV